MRRPRAIAVSAVEVESGPNGLPGKRLQIALESNDERFVSELNGTLPSGYDWHQRLLERLQTRRGDRPPVLTPETARSLQEYLGFCHVVRNLYGFELDPERLDRLAAQQKSVGQQFDFEVRHFLDWLRTLAGELDELDELGDR